MALTERTLQEIFETIRLYELRSITCTYEEDRKIWKQAAQFLRDEISRRTRKK